MVLDWGLNLGPHALDASTLPLGYRGGGVGKLMLCCCLQLIKKKNAKNIKPLNLVVHVGTSLQCFLARLLER